jgi:hypothetical protein
MTFGKSGSKGGNGKGGFYAEFAVRRQGFKPLPESIKGAEAH